MSHPPSNSHPDPRPAPTTYPPPASAFRQPSTPQHPQQPQHYGQSQSTPYAQQARPQTPNTNPNYSQGQGRPHTPSGSGYSGAQSQYSQPQPQHLQQQRFQQQQQQQHASPSYNSTPRPSYPSHQQGSFSRPAQQQAPPRLALPGQAGQMRQGARQPIGTHGAQGQASTSAAGAGTAAGRGKQGRKNLFARDLYSMMYGFGDDEKPAHDSVLLMEDLVVTHLLNVLEAAKLTSPTPKRLRVEDIKRVYRHDKKKLDRIEELLWMRKEIERARRVDDFKEFVEEEKEKEREQRRRA